MRYEFSTAGLICSLFSGKVNGQKGLDYRHLALPDVDHSTTLGVNPERRRAE